MAIYTEGSVIKSRRAYYPGTCNTQLTFNTLYSTGNCFAQLLTSQDFRNTQNMLLTNNTPISDLTVQKSTSNRYYIGKLQGSNYDITTMIFNGSSWSIDYSTAPSIQVANNASSSGVMFEDGAYLITIYNNLSNNLEYKAYNKSNGNLYSSGTLLLPNVQTVVTTDLGIAFAHSSKDSGNYIIYRNGLNNTNPDPFSINKVVFNATTGSLTLQTSEYTVPNFETNVVPSMTWLPEDPSVPAGEGSWRIIYATTDELLHINVMRDAKYVNNQNLAVRKVFYPFALRSIVSTRKMSILHLPYWQNAALLILNTNADGKFMSFFPYADSYYGSVVVPAASNDYQIINQNLCNMWNVRDDTKFTSNGQLVNRTCTAPNALSVPPIVAGPTTCALSPQ